MMLRNDIAVDKVWSVLSEVMDPEVPVLSILDLGIVRDVQIKDGEPEVVITPTYSGCPAMDVISMNIRIALLSHGYRNPSVHLSLSPAWTTDWMTEEGKRKLAAYGIAPPNPKQQVCHDDLFLPDEAVQCPRCQSYLTHRVSEFGSTPCKSLFQCDECREPFDYFKCH